MSFLKGYKLIDLSPKLVPGKEERRLQIRRFIFELDNTIMHDVDTMTHIGSHIEAPLHYKDGLKDVTELPLESFIGEGLLLYFDFLKPGNPITPDAVRRAAYPSTLTKGDIVLLHSPYTGDQRPYIARQTAKFFLESGIKMLGIGNTVQLEEKGEMFTHDYLLGNDIPIIEGLVNMDELPRRFIFIGFPIRIQGLDSSWIRAVALVEEKEVEG
jgi:kynurenine formamidase